MSRAYKCDHCGTFFAKRSFINREEISIDGLIKRVTIVVEDCFHKEEDSCPNCMKALLYRIIEKI